MHLEFRRLLGDTVADTVMEHLPPAGWGDVARTSDVERLERQVADVKSEMKAGFRNLAAGMWAMGTISSACFVAVFTILATKL